MKKLQALLLSIISIVTITCFSGCSDFAFNPIGTWMFTDDILFQDGKEIDHATPEHMLYRNMEYIFEKSGTGYIMVDGTRTLSFTYEYDHEDVTLYVTDTYHPDQTVALHYHAEENGTKLIRRDEGEFQSDDGKKYILREEYILTKK